MYVTKQQETTHYILIVWLLSWMRYQESFKTILLREIALETAHFPH